jgi:hypothetical protein
MKRILLWFRKLHSNKKSPLVSEMGKLSQNISSENQFYNESKNISQIN